MMSAAVTSTASDFDERSRHHLELSHEATRISEPRPSNQQPHARRACYQCQYRILRDLNHRGPPNIDNDFITFSADCHHRWGATSENRHTAG